MSKLSPERISQIVTEQLQQLPEEERVPAYDDVLYLFNKELKKSEMFELQDLTQSTDYQHETFDSSTEIAQETTLLKLLEKFIHFRLLAITPASKNKQVLNVSMEKRRTINNISSFSSIKIIPKTPEQIKMFSKIFENNVFSGLSPRQRRRFISCLEPVETQIDEVIIRKGEDGSKLFFLEKGLFSLLLNENEKSNLPHENRPKRKIIFENKPMVEIQLPLHTVTGEIALLHNIPRTATIISRAPGMVWTLSRNVYRTIRLFDEEQKWIAFIDKMIHLGYTKSYLAGNAQRHVFDENVPVRLSKCPNCNQFVENCCSYSLKMFEANSEPLYLFFSSFAAKIKVNDEVRNIPGCDIIEENFTTMTEIEGYIVPKNTN